MKTFPLAESWSRSFLLNNCTYIVAVDYNSRYPEIQKFSSNTAHVIIVDLKRYFSFSGYQKVTMVLNLHRKSFANLQKIMTFIM